MFLKACLLCLLCLCLLAACAPRASDPVEPPPSSAVSSSEPREPEPPAPEPEPKQEPGPEAEQEEESAPAYEAPLLADTEKQLLTGYLSLFVQFVGARETSADALSQETILAAAIADIERTKDMNAYFFEQDEDKNDLIPAALVTDKILQLFGIDAFDGTGAESYDAEKECYTAQPVEIAAVQASDIMGAPDGNVAYAVKTDDGQYIYTCKLLRQNSMPYLRFVSAQAASPSEDALLEDSNP